MFYFFEPLLSGSTSGLFFLLVVCFLPRDLGAGFAWANILLGEKLLKSLFDAQGVVVSLGEFADSRWWVQSLFFRMCVSRSDGQTR